MGKTKMLTIAGEFEHALDDKNRLFISNKLRSQIDSAEYGSDFYLAMGPNRILCLYPEKRFQQIALAGAPGMGAPDESVAYERLSFALAGKAELDRQGRLLINDKLRKRAGLGTNLTLVGVRDHIEIWNTEDWDQYVEAKLSQFTNQMAQSRHVLIERHAREMELKGEKP